MVVDGNDDLPDAMTAADAIDDMLNERFAGVSGENFGGETGRAQAGGNYNRRSQQFASNSIIGADRNCGAKILGEAGGVKLVGFRV